MDLRTVVELTKGCKAQQLTDDIEFVVFGSAETNMTREQHDRAKVALQDLFHKYRLINPCKASAFTAVHRCIYEVYCDAYDRLMNMYIVPSLSPPPKPKRTRRARQSPPPASPTYTEFMGKLQEVITGVPLGKVVDDDPFNE